MQITGNQHIKRTKKYVFFTKNQHFTNHNTIDFHIFQY